MAFVSSVFQPSALRILIWPEASSAQNSIAAIFADRSTVCVLTRRIQVALHFAPHPPYRVLADRAVERAPSVPTGCVFVCEPAIGASAAKVWRW